MKNNKGYTLTELLVSIAVFAIAMVGIISVMSNAIKAYSKANLDVTVQENAQLVANQIEEMLCDADHISGSGPYTFKKGSDVSSLKLDGTNLILSKDTDSDGTPDEDFILAKNVSTFTIDSYGAANNFGTVAGYTNKVKSFNEASINISFDDNHGTTYDLTRNVYFRNEIEDSKFHGIEYTSSNLSSGGGSPSANIKTLNVKRYETYNLTTENEIKYDCKLCKEVPASTPGCFTLDGKFFVEDSTAATYFTLSSVDNFPSESYEDDDGNKPYEGALTYTLKASATVNGNFSNPLAGNQYYACGYSDKAKTTVKVCKLTVDAVSLGDTVLNSHDAADVSVNGEGFTNPVEVKGININEAIKAGTTVKANIVFSGEKTGSFTEATLSSVTGITDQATNLGQNNSVQITMGVYPDPFNGGINVKFNNDGMQHYEDSGNLNATLTLKIGSETLTKTYIVDRLDTPLYPAP